MKHVCPKCKQRYLEEKIVPMELKAIISNLAVYQCPDCKNIELEVI